MTPHRPKNKMSTDKTKAPVIRLLPTAVLWAWLHAPSCCSASSSSLTQTWSNILDQPGPVNNTQVWVVFLIQRIEASGKQTPGWFKFENISNRNLLKTAFSNILKSIRQKKWISAAFLCPVLSLRYVLLLLKQNSPTLSYAILMTQPQERHRQTTSDVQQIKNYSYTKKKKSQRGDHRADGDKHWGVYPDMVGSGSASAWAHNKHWLGLSLSPPHSSDPRSCSLFSSMWLWSHLGSQNG